VIRPIEVFIADQVSDLIPGLRIDQQAAEDGLLTFD